MSKTAVDAGWKEYATPRQCKIIDAAIEHGNPRKAAEALGMSRSGVRRSLERAAKSAAQRGYAPAHDMTKPTPEGFSVKGTSTLYNSEGRKVSQWVKTSKDREDQWAGFEEAVSGLLEQVRKHADPTDPPAVSSSADTLPMYVIGDLHVGMRSWGEETGADYDVEIAERLLNGAINRLVPLSEPSDQALLVNVGDFVHFDGYEPKTERSGNVLDADTRWPHVLRTSARMLRYCVDRMLTRHRTVKVICQAGNHDTRSALFLSMLLEAFYEREPRVEIDTGYSPYHYHRFGENLIGVTHGDLCKIADLPSIMSVDQKRNWGECTHCRWITGHVHHDQTKEFRGCTVETFRTLAARDAWHHGSGYRSGRDMRCIVLDRHGGERVRYTVGVEEALAA